MESHEIDRNSARDLLARADASSASTRSAMQRDRNRHAQFAAFVGVAMAAYLFITMVWVTRTTWLWAVALVLYVVGILWMTARFNRLRSSAPPGWARSYRRAMIVSLVFYLGGIALNSAYLTWHDWSAGSTAALAAVLAVATAAPQLIVARRTQRGDTSMLAR